MHFIQKKKRAVDDYYADEASPSCPLPLTLSENSSNFPGERSDCSVSRDHRACSPHLLHKTRIHLDLYLIIPSTLHQTTPHLYQQIQLHLQHLATLLPTSMAHQPLLTWLPLSLLTLLASGQVCWETL